jgi:DNA-binding NarL/FixJ family response regulator
MRKYRIIIADDHEITRIGLKSILASTGIYEVCGEAGDGHEAIEKTCQLKPDLLILDVGLPQLNGVEVARRIEMETAHTSILIFTEVESERLMLDALRLGVKGFIVKSESACDLLSGIDTVLHGKTCFTPRISQILLDFARQNGRAEVLTSREREIVQLVAEGHCTKDVARMLAMSVKTAETHRSNILRKLQVHTTAELILYAVRNQIVHIEHAPQELCVLPFAKPAHSTSQASSQLAATA